MHYPLHITVLCTGLWILQDDANAAKTGVSVDVLTSFAKNVASILSSTLLSDFQDTFLNQSADYLASLKKAQETHTLSVESIKPKGSDIPAKTSVERLKRFAQGYQSLDEGRKGFQHAYVTSNEPQYAKRYNPEYILNRGQNIQDEANIQATENISSDTKENSIDADINAASLHYTNHYHHSPDFRYKPDHVHPLDNANHHGHFGFHPHYHLHQASGAAPAQPAEGSEGNAAGNEDVQPARLTHGPYNLNYHGPYHAPHHPPLYRHPGTYYPHGGPVEGNGQPVAPPSEQDAGNPSRLTDDQNQGQSAVGGYDYSPRFHYRPPYHDGFYGPPDFYHGPFNASFNPGYPGQPAGNSTNGQFPNGPHPFHGYGFYPNGPYQPYYPNFYGNGRPAQPENPPESSGTPEQTSPENGQGNGTSTGNRPPHGFPPHGPFYGDFHLPGYPVLPFNALPYHRFGPVFHDHLIPRFKAAPYLHLHPDPYPLAHWYPFGGYYPNHNGQRPATMPESPKPEQAEKSVSDAPETSEPPMNSDAEMIPEGSSDIVQALPSNRRGNLLFPWPLSKENDESKRGQALKQSS